MDNKLDILRHLYGEVDDRSERRDLLRDEEVAREYQAMGEVKFLLDHRPRRRPDQQVLQNILAAAETGPPPVASRASDRAPVRRPSIARRGLLGLVGTTVAAAVVALVFWWQPGSPGPEETLSPAAAGDVAVLEQEALMPAEEAASDWDTSVAASRAELTSASVSDVVEWEATDDLLLLHRQIETLQRQRLELAWDEPLQPLGRMPASGAPMQQGLQEASQRQQ